MGKDIKYSYIIDSKQAISSLEKINRALDKTNKKLKKSKSFPSIGSESKGKSGKIGGGFSASSFAGTAAIAGLGASLLALGNQSLEVAAKVQGLDSAIKFAGGPEGQFNLAFLNKTVNSLGLESISAKEGFKVWTAAIKDSALEGRKGRKIFESFAKSTKRLGLSADDTKGVFLALGQMVSKGKVSMEELRQQLGERMPGAFQAAARAMGVTTAELDRLVSTGEVTAEELLPKMAMEMEKTFGGPMEAQLSNSINRIKNVWTNSMVSMGNALAPLAEATANFMEMASNSDAISLAEKEQDRFRTLSGVIDSLNQKIKSGALTNDEAQSLIQTYAKRFGDLAPILNEINLETEKGRGYLNDIVEASSRMSSAKKGEIALQKKQNRLLEIEEKLKSREADRQEFAQLGKIKKEKGLDFDQALRRGELQRSFNNEASERQKGELTLEEAKLRNEINQLEIASAKVSAKESPRLMSKKTQSDLKKENDLAVEAGETVLKNDVRGVSGQVKNITVNVDSVQKIDTQNINSGDDIESLGVQLEELMARITLDIAQK